MLNALLETSSLLPFLYNLLEGPRVVTVSMADLPVSRLVTLILVPSGKSHEAAISDSSCNSFPLLIKVREPSFKQLALVKYEVSVMKDSAHTEVESNNNKPIIGATFVFLPFPRHTLNPERFNRPYALRSAFVIDRQGTVSFNLGALLTEQQDSGLDLSIFYAFRRNRV